MITFDEDYFVIIEEMHMSINIKQVLPQQYTIPILAGALDLVDEVKAELEEWTELEPERMILIYAGKALANGRTLSSLNIKHGCTLQLLPNSRTTVQIFVNLLTGKTITFECDIKYTEDTLKADVFALTGIPDMDLQLTYSENFLRCFVQSG